MRTRVLYGISTFRKKKFKNLMSWSSCLGSAETSLTSIHEDAGSILGLAQWVRDPACSELWCRLQTCGVGCRHGLELVLLWLWYRPVTMAPIRPLAWEPPYATDVALKRPKKKKKSNILRKGTWKPGRFWTESKLSINYVCHKLFQSFLFVISLI